MFHPEKVKHRKIFGPRRREVRLEKKVYMPSFGQYGIQAVEGGIIDVKELVSAWKTLRKGIKKRGEIWVTVIADKSVSGKPIGIRMGKGKGRHDRWTCLFSKGRVLFEVSTKIKSDKVVKGILNQAQGKLSIKTKVIEYKL